MSKDLFSFINSINDQEYIWDQEDTKDFNPYITLSAFSFYPDTVLIANEANRYGKMDKKQLYDLLFYSISKKKRYSKWFKKEKDEEIDFLMKAFKCNYIKAKEYNSVLTELQKEQIKKYFDVGGVK